MARSSSHLRSGPYFATLAGLLVIGYLLVFFTGSGVGPKLGLDLRGGTTVTLKAQTRNGAAPKKADLNTARDIIENRVNGLGVANSDVVTQGNDSIVISVPGKNGEQAKTLGTTAQLFFRPLLSLSGIGPPQNTPTAAPTTGSSGPPTPSTGATSTAPGAGTSASGSPSGAGGSPSASASASPQGDVVPHLAAPSAQATTAAPSASAPAASAPVPSASSPAGSVPSGVPASLAPDVNKSCATLSKQAAKADPKKPILACDAKGVKYALGMSLFPGKDVKGASAQYQPPPQGQGWTIELNLKGSAQGIWTKYTAANHNPGGSSGSQDPTPANYVAFVLDGRILSSPNITGTISGTTQVTGSFDSASAKNLANSLKFGALPLTFTTSNAQTISATLGAGQLHAGLLAGGIGLVLVVIYSLIYYRALGLVTIASLVVSGLMVYACVVLLGRQLGFTLTLAGIAGFIVAVGITADSFVVFFERLKEEVHGGRTMRSGVPRAWVRARRTILSADAVSFLAAAILYYLAAGEVRGFAFTLGLSTILDLIVVFLFTHPLISVASRSRTFSSPRLSGLKAVEDAARAQARAASAARPSAQERAAARRGAVKES